MMDTLILCNKDYNFTNKLEYHLLECEDDLYYL